MYSKRIMVTLKVVFGVFITLMTLNPETEGRISSRISRVNKHGPFLGLVVPNSFEMDPLLESKSFVADGSYPHLDFAETEGRISSRVYRRISRVNKHGPFLGLVVPNSFEMDPLLESKSFVADGSYPHLDFAGRRFRIGSIENKSVIVVMTGLSMLNAGITTQLLLSLFRVEGVVHFGIAGNANPQHHIGDVTIPRFWAHTGLWNWQRQGDGPNDELALETNGDYTRKIGYLNFTSFNNNTKEEYLSENLLNNVWYQPEEVFPIDGEPEIREHAFWVPVDRGYFEIAEKLEDMKLEGCINATTCLSTTPVVLRVSKGISANVYLDNAAYRNFLYSKFNVTPVDMESAAVALICHQQRIPFLTLRGLSDLAGGGSESNEASTFESLAAQNVVDVVIKFIQLLYY